jgi:UDP-N-acetylmuramyl pentapeptide phosphotransferase/UDP-N-acetylglucosamine-1-phosphate transferase
MSVAGEIVLGVVVLGLLIYRQLRSRPVNSSGLRLAAVLGVIGLIEAYQFLDKHHSGAVTYAALGGSLLLAAVFAALRAATVRVWLQGNQPWTKGNWLTAVLWVLALAAHLGYDALVTPGRGSGGLGAATVVLYLAVSLGIQRVITQQRANRLQPGGPTFSDSGSGRFS